MISFTDTIQIGRSPIIVPLRYDGKPVKDIAAETATEQFERCQDRGVLLYRIGVTGSKLLPYGWKAETQLDLKHVYDKQLDAEGATELARVFHNTGLLAGPTICVLEEIGMRYEPQQWMVQSKTPVLVPDRIHMEHMMDALCATGLPADLISQACAKVAEVRAYARLMAT